MASRILNFGHDRTLLSTRGLVLSHEGFEVVNVTDSRQAIGVLIAQHVDLLVLCHTLAEQELQRILSIARTSGQETKALILLASTSSALPADSSASVCSIDGPRCLLATVHQLIDQHETSSQALTS
jgi:CheY-like chemotaxis protein